jgi:hypothetical protein
VIIAEAAVHVKDRQHFPAHLEKMGLTLLPLPISAAPPAARAFSKYLERLKADGIVRHSRTPPGDFLIGAHAETEGLKLVTRDCDRIKSYFPSVKLIAPPENFRGNLRRRA